MNTVEVKKIWEEIKSELSNIVPESSYGPWIAPLEAVSFEDNQFTLISNAAFAVKYLRENHYKTILDCFRNHFGKEIIVNIEFNQEYADKLKKEKQKEERKLQKEKKEEEEHNRSIKNLSYVKSLNINLRYRFDNFVEDSNNKIAKAAAESVAKNPTATYNPLYIQGGSGLGKTHLMQAIGHYVTLKGNLKVQCIKTEDFINDYVNSTRFTPNQNKNTTIAMNKFRNKYRNVDILLIDEILAVGDAHFQDKCFKKLDELKNSDKTIVIVSHSLGSVKKLCDRAVWLHEGKIQLDSNSGEVIDEYMKVCG